MLPCIVSLEFTICAQVIGIRSNTRDLYYKNSSPIRLASAVPKVTPAAKYGVINETA